MISRATPLPPVPPGPRRAGGRHRSSLTSRASIVTLHYQPAYHEPERRRPPAAAAVTRSVLIAQLALPERRAAYFNTTDNVLGSRFVYNAS